MPDLDFRIVGVEAAARGLTPLIQFKLEVTNTPETETVQSVMLQAQIQIQAPQRAYDAPEREKLFEIFGTPDQWGQTLRTKLWTHANANIRQFSGRTEGILPVTCTYDLNVMATKYFYALNGGSVPLLFLFSGTIFYLNSENRLQVQQVSWNKECTYEMPVTVWRELMDHHYPNSAWISLDRNIFDRLYEYKRRHGCATWEKTMECLLAQSEDVQMTKHE